MTTTKAKRLTRLLCLILMLAFAFAIGPIGTVPAQADGGSGDPPHYIEDTLILTDTTGGGAPAEPTNNNLLSLIETLLIVL